MIFIPLERYCRVVFELFYLNFSLYFAVKTDFGGDLGGDFSETHIRGLRGQKSKMQYCFRGNFGGSFR